jgi:hypothetical protein
MSEMSRKAIKEAARRRSQIWMSMMAKSLQNCSNGSVRLLGKEYEREEDPTEVLRLASMQRNRARKRRKLPSSGPRPVDGRPGSKVICDEIDSARGSLRCSRWLGKGLTRPERTYYSHIVRAYLADLGSETLIEGLMWHTLTYGHLDGNWSSKPKRHFIPVIRIARLTSHIQHSPGARFYDVWQTGGAAAVHRSLGLQHDRQEPA